MSFVQTLGSLSGPIPSSAIGLGLVFRPKISTYPSSHQDYLPFLPGESKSFEKVFVQRKRVTGGQLRTPSCFVVPTLLHLLQHDHNFDWNPLHQLPCFDSIDFVPLQSVGSRSRRSFSRSPKRKRSDSDSDSSPPSSPPSSQSPIASRSSRSSVSSPSYQSPVARARSTPAPSRGSVARSRSSSVRGTARSAHFPSDSSSSPSSDFGSAAARGRTRPPPDSRSMLNVISLTDDSGDEEHYTPSPLSSSSSSVSSSSSSPKPRVARAQHGRGRSFPVQTSVIDLCDDSDGDDNDGTKFKFEDIDHSSSPHRTSASSAANARSYPRVLFPSPSFPRRPRASNSTRPPLSSFSPVDHARQHPCKFEDSCDDQPPPLDAGLSSAPRSARTANQPDDEEEGDDQYEVDQYALAPPVVVSDAHSLENQSIQQGPVESEASAPPNPLVSHSSVSLSSSAVNPDVPIQQILASIPSLIEECTSPCFGDFQSMFQSIYPAIRHREQQIFQQLLTSCPVDDMDGSRHKRVLSFQCVVVRAAATPHDSDAPYMCVLNTLSSVSTPVFVILLEVSSHDDGGLKSSLRLLFRVDPDASDT